VCNLSPCCHARLYCLFYVFFCVLSKINDDEPVLLTLFGGGVSPGGISVHPILQFVAFMFNAVQRQKQRSVAVRRRCQLNGDDWQQSWTAARCSQCHRSQRARAACRPSSTATCRGMLLVRSTDSLPRPTTASLDAYRHLQRQTTFNIINQAWTSCAKTTH